MRPVFKIYFEFISHFSTLTEVFKFIFVLFMDCLLLNDCLVSPFNVNYNEVEKKSATVQLFNILVANFLYKFFVN